MEGTSHSKWERQSAGLIKHGSTERMLPCRLRFIDCLNLSEMEQKSENKEEVNSYGSNKIRSQEITNNM